MPTNKNSAVATPLVCALMRPRDVPASCAMPGLRGQPAGAVVRGAVLWVYAPACLLEMRRALRSGQRCRLSVHAPPCLQASAKPTTPCGKLMDGCLRMEPQLFNTAVEDQLRKMHEEKEAGQHADKAAAAPSSSRARSAEHVLYS